jgi:DNA-binding CsgD family transcriptional regulator
MLPKVRAMTALDTILNLVPFGLVLATHRGVVVHSNAVARELLADAQFLELKDGRLAAKSTVYQRALDEAIRQVGQGKGFVRPMGFNMARRGLPPVLVTVLPTKSETGSRGGGKVLILISDPIHRCPVDSDLIGHLFDFTHAEAVIASHLVNGDDICQIALNLKVSRHTVRNHLKRLYSKTNTKTQCEFLRVLLRSPAGLRCQIADGPDHTATPSVSKTATSIVG